MTGPFVVEICSDVYGDIFAVCHELSTAHAYVVVAMGYAPPLDTPLTMRIASTRGVVAENVDVRARVTGITASLPDTGGPRLVAMRIFAVCWGNGEFDCPSASPH